MRFKKIAGAHVYGSRLPVQKDTLFKTLDIEIAYLFRTRDHQNRTLLSGTPV